MIFNILALYHILYDFSFFLSLFLLLSLFLSLSSLIAWLSPLAILCSVSSLIFISGFFHGSFFWPLEENKKPNPHVPVRLSDFESSYTFGRKQHTFCPFSNIFFNKLNFK